jgi:hypothetical protein
MKFNPNDWSEVKANETFKVPACNVRLRCTGEASVFVTTEGVESLQGVGQTFNFTVSAPSEIKVNIVKPGRVFMRDVVRRAFEDKSEVFTNIDRLPNESGPLQEVTRALRVLKLEERAMIRRIRAEREAAMQVIDVDDKPDAEPAPAPAPAPAPSPAPAP